MNKTLQSEKPDISLGSNIVYCNVKEMCINAFPTASYSVLLNADTFA